MRRPDLDRLTGRRAVEQRMNEPRGKTVASAYPVVTLILAAIFLAEPITLMRAGGALLVIGGVVLISLGG